MFGCLKSKKEEDLERRMIEATAKRIVEIDNRIPQNDRGVFYEFSAVFIMLNPELPYKEVIDAYYKAREEGTVREFIEKNMPPTYH